MRNSSRLKIDYSFGIIRLPTLLVSIFFIISTNTFSQVIIIIGKSYDKENRNLPLPKLMIINKRTNNGTFSDSEGKFVYVMSTILLSAYTANVTMISGGVSSDMDSELNIPPDYQPLVIEYIKKQLLFEASQPVDVTNDGLDARVTT